MKLGRRRQQGQALVGVLATMVIVFAMAGGLAVAVSALLERQSVTATTLAGGYRAEGAVDAGMAWAAGRGLGHGTSCSTDSATTLRPGVDVPADLPGLQCRELPIKTAGAPKVAPLAFSGGCAVSPLSQATGRSWVWFTASGTTSAWVDGSPSGCAGPSGAVCAATAGGPVAQIVLDCVLSGPSFLHVTSAGGAAGSARYAPHADPNLFVAAPNSPVPVSHGGAPAAMTPFLFNGEPYLAIGQPGTKEVTVLVNGGGGTMLRGRTTSLPQSPIGLAAGQFLGSGRSDLAVISSDTLYLLPGAADGSFDAPSQTIPFGSDAGLTSIAAGAFTGSGHDDLAITAGDPDRVYVLTGDGLHGFKAPFPSSSLMGNPNASAIVASSGGGKASLAVAESPDDVEVLKVGTDGTFDSEVNFDVGGAPNGITTGDLNRDGVPDLITANASGSLSVMLGQAGGGFSAPSTASVGSSSPVSVAASNFGGSSDVVFIDGSGTATLEEWKAGSLHWVGDVPLGNNVHDTKTVVAVDFDGPVTGFATTNAGSDNVSVELWHQQPVWGAAFLIAVPPTLTPGAHGEDADLLVSWDGSTDTMTYEGKV